MFTLLIYLVHAPGFKLSLDCSFSYVFVYVLFWLFYDNVLFGRCPLTDFVCCCFIYFIFFCYRSNPGSLEFLTQLYTSIIVQPCHITSLSIVCTYLNYFSYASKLISISLKNIFFSSIQIKDKYFFQFYTNKGQIFFSVLYKYRTS